MDFLLSFGRHTFASLSVRNYRLYFIGEIISMSGSWMQTVALGWLVLQLTGSGTLLGTLLAFRYFPMFVLGPFAGTIVDRFDKRLLLYITQTLLGILSLIVGVLVVTGTTDIWILCLIAFLSGIVNSVDNPTRQTFVHEMVGREHLRNAITLNSTVTNLARVIGPAIAGIIIATMGLAVCFFADAASFCSILITLALMQRHELHREEHGSDVSRTWRATIPYLKTRPVLLSILVASAIIGTLTFEFQVSLPLLAQKTFLGSAADYAALLSAMGIGSIAGGLFSASRREIAVSEFVLFALLFGVAVLITAYMPSLGLATVGMVLVGFFSINMTSTGNTVLQLESAPEMRGRVMSLWSMAFLGSTVVGGPLIGFVGEHVDPREALALGGVAAMFAALYAGRRILDREHIFRIPAWLYARRDDTNVSTKL
jgi:MFS family permease